MKENAVTCGKDRQRAAVGKGVNRRRIGTGWEERAARWLTERGFRIVERNYRCRLGEIDIVAAENVEDPAGCREDYLVFIEVKYRTSDYAGGPLAAVNRPKQMRIIRAAQVYMKQRGIGEMTPVRFDVVGITPREITLIRDAFRL